MNSIISASVLSERDHQFPLPGPVVQIRPFAVAAGACPLASLIVFVGHQHWKQNRPQWPLQSVPWPSTISIFDSRTESVSQEW